MKLSKKVVQMLKKHDAKFCAGKDHFSVFWDWHDHLDQRFAASAQYNGTDYYLLYSHQDPLATHIIDRNAEMLIMYKIAKRILAASKSAKLPENALNWAKEYMCYDYAVYADSLVKADPQILLDESRGIYIPKEFCKDLYIETNPDDEYYWDEFAEIITAINSHMKNGYIELNGDLWLCHKDFSFEQ